MVYPEIQTTAYLIAPSWSVGASVSGDSFITLKRRNECGCSTMTANKKPLTLFAWMPSSDVEGERFFVLSCMLLKSFQR